MTDHDQRFKALLQAFLPEFFELFFPEWAARFDFSRVEWLEQEVFPDPPEGKRRVLDLVAKLPTRDPQPDAADAWLSLIHVEIESAESVAPFRRRMFQYYANLRDRRDLPVLPVAVYLRVGLDGVGLDEYREAFGTLELLNFRYLRVGLPSLDAVEYLRRGNALGLALAALMRLPAEGRARLKADILLQIARSELSEQQRFLLAECVQAYFRLMEPTEQQEFETLVREEPYAEVTSMATTWFEEGLEQGLEQGLDAQRQLLVLQIEERFGTLEPADRERLMQWPAEQLPDLARKIVRAQSLRDLGLGE